MSYYVYILTNFTNRILDTGVTNDLGRRTYEHRKKLVEGFSKRYNVWKLVYFEESDVVLSAIEREQQVKAGSRRRKVELIDARSRWRDLYLELSEGKER